jgi:hypothetical protein
MWPSGLIAVAIVRVDPGASSVAQVYAFTSCVFVAGVCSTIPVSVKPTMLPHLYVAFLRDIAFPPLAFELVWRIRWRRRKFDFGTPSVSRRSVKAENADENDNRL